MFDPGDNSLIVFGTKINVVLKAIQQWLSAGIQPTTIGTEYGTLLPQYTEVEGARYCYIPFQLPEGVEVYRDSAENEVVYLYTTGFRIQY